jgi:hypothetical protein
MAIPPLNFKGRAWRLRHSRQVIGAAAATSVFAVIRDLPDLL